MIRYRLVCEQRHEFEAWFPSSKAYDSQARRKLVSCPACDSIKISKAIMAPRIVTSERSTKGKTRRAGKETVPEAATASPPSPSPQLVANAEQRELMAKMRKLRNEVLAKSEYVGPRFAEEARKIHEQEDSKPAPRRGIYGEASRAEVEALAEDGIEVFPVPVLPDDQN